MFVVRAPPLIGADELDGDAGAKGDVPIETVLARPAGPHQTQFQQRGVLR